MSILTVKNLCKTYNAKRRRGRSVVNAVDGATFSLKPGDRAGIIGASGCGKTTILKMILGLTAPTSGEIVLNASAGFVAQDPYSSLCHAMTVAEIIAEPLVFTKKYRKAAQCTEEVRRVMALVNLSYDEYASRYPHQISGGERQRVSIARAMINRPEILVLDEPTSMIDFEVKSSIIEVIKKITESEGTAILLVTHDIAVARELCGTLFVMNDGKIMETGAVEEIMKNPRNEYTKKLILAGSDIEAYWDMRSLRLPQLQGNIA